MREIPMLFQGDMVSAILDKEKTETRRVIKFPPNEHTGEPPRADSIKLIQNNSLDEYASFGIDEIYSVKVKTPCREGDILWVRETWQFIPCTECVQDINGTCRENPVFYEDKKSTGEGCFIYRASYYQPERINWRPSIHMPKKAGRIRLKVKKVTAERLQDITAEGAEAEGTRYYCSLCENRHICGRDQIIKKECYRGLWESTLKESDKKFYGWEANPWVWRIKFNQI